MRRHRQAGVNGVRHGNTYRPQKRPVGSIRGGEPPETIATPFELEPERCAGGTPVDIGRELAGTGSTLEIGAKRWSDEGHHIWGCRVKRLTEHQSCLGVAV